MIAQKYSKLSLCVLSVIIAIQLSLLVIFPPKNVLSYDVFGYYLYLPQTFIYNDLAIKNEARIYEILDKYHNSETFYQAAKSRHNNQYVMKYSMGMAVLYSPFFAIGHVTAKIFNYEADGFSKPYQNSVLYGCFLYTIIGLVYLRKTLKLFFSEAAVSITLLSIFFATNYFAHIPLFGQGAMSHNALFTLYVLIVYCTILWHKNHETKYSIALGISIGLASLIRPSEIISLSIPLFYNVFSFQDLKEKLKLLIQYKAQILRFCFIVTGTGFMQLIYFKMYAGKFIYNSYGANPGEGFEFSHPYIMEVLFSFKKGWIIYTPLVIFFIAGLFTKSFKSSGLKSSLLVFLILTLYIVSSWSCWWYAESFGQRALIPCFALLSIPFASLINEILTSKLKSLVLFTIIVFSFLNIFQTWQLANGIIDGERMTKAYYISTFLQTKLPSAEQKELLLIDRGKTLNDNLTEEDLLKLKSCKTEILDFENNTSANSVICDTLLYSGKKSMVLARDSASPVIRTAYADVTGKYYALIKVSAWYFNNSDTKVKLKVAMEHNGYEYKLRFRTSQPTAKKGWNKIELIYLTPEVRNRKDNLKVYIENISKTTVFIDDLKYEAFEPKEDKSVF